MRTGKQEVKYYEGTIPKSGKQVITFAGHKLVHRSVGADGSDLLVHMDSKVIIRSYPKNTDRSKVLDDIANNIERLEYFIEHREEFKEVEKVKVSVKGEDGSKVYSNTFKEPSYSTQGNYSHLNKDSSCVDGSCSSFKQEFMLPLKKSYDLRDVKW